MNERMIENQPDRWIVVKVNSTTTDVAHYRLYAMWTGGFVDGDAWKLNSGIESVKDDGDFLVFVGTSGSRYRCHKQGYGLTGYGSMELIGLIDRFRDTIEPLYDEEDWLAKDWKETKCV